MSDDCKDYYFALSGASLIELNMSEIDYDKLYKRAIAYAKKRGIESDAEDFAQECLIKAFEVGNINLEYVFLNFRSFHRANKRILGNSNAALGATQQAWLDSSINESDPDSSRLSDFIGDTRDDVGTVTELESINELVELLFSTIQNRDIRSWAKKQWLKFIEDNL